MHADKNSKVSMRGIRKISSNRRGLIFDQRSNRGNIRDFPTVLRRSIIKIRKLFMHQRHWPVFVLSRELMYRMQKLLSLVSLAN